MRLRFALLYQIMDNVMMSNFFKVHVKPINHSLNGIRQLICTNMFMFACLWLLNDICVQI